MSTNSWPCKATSQAILSGSCEKGSESSFWHLSGHRERVVHQLTLFSAWWDRALFGGNWSQCLVLKSHPNERDQGFIYVSFQRSVYVFCGKFYLATEMAGVVLGSWTFTFKLLLVYPPPSLLSLSITSVTWINTCLQAEIYVIQVVQGGKIGINSLKHEWWFLIISHLRQGAKIFPKAILSPHSSDL